ncbi:MAG TPA: HAD-IA family hydrolase [Anaerolineae bacterium]|nr:MAG: hypothetical protein AMJ88_16175 [Anaerolineae bacterium SM23_ 63]HEY45102.1 HAD-IA family hydrolase [Anaerolineae bacterium]
MVECVIFDLSEVLIPGLVGVEKELSRYLGIPEKEILPCFEGRMRDKLFLRQISEEVYIEHIIDQKGWDISIEKVKQAIRNNFHNEIEGSREILTALAPRVDLVLLSDHAQEWVSYIRTAWPFLSLFQHTFFSFELGRMKDDPQTFHIVLNTLMLSPASCLFIDDNPGNVEIAEAVGIPSIRFLDAKRLAEQLKVADLKCVQHKNPQQGHDF